MKRGVNTPKALLADITALGKKLKSKLSLLRIIGGGLSWTCVRIIIRVLKRLRSALIGKPAVLCLYYFGYIFWGLGFRCILRELDKRISLLFRRIRRRRRFSGIGCVCRHTLRVRSVFSNGRIIQVSFGKIGIIWLFLNICKQKLGRFLGNSFWYKKCVLWFLVTVFSFWEKK